MALAKIVFISITIGCLCQLYDWSVLYHSDKEQAFEAVSDGDIVYEKLPAITFCLNQENSIKKHRDLGLTTNEILNFNKVKDYADKIKITSFYDEKVPDLNYLLDKTIETISYKDYCFTINSRLTGTQVQIKRDQQFWIKLVQFDYPRKVCWVYLHNSYDVLSSYEWISRDIPQGHIFTIGYNKESINRNENCQDYYMNTEYTSRRDCIRKCKLKRSIEKCGVVYNGIDIKKTTENYKFATLESEKSCIESMLSYGDFCNETCRLNDCRTDAYEPYLISTYSIGTNYTWLQIIPPTRSQVVFKEIPKINLFAYTFFLAGSFSVWLGFALYFLIHLCRKSYVLKDVQGHNFV